MTKKRAIMAALLKYDDDGNADALADRSYEAGHEAGRIAGLREAAQIAMAFDGGWQPYTGEIQKHSNQLANKARAK